MQQHVEQRSFREVFAGAFLLDSPTFGDDRGFFREWYRQKDVEQAVGRPVHVLQANHSFSRKGVLRGIHVATYEKLIYAASGKALIGLVDARPDSETFGKHHLVEIGEHNRLSIFLPAGVGNSYYVMSDGVHYCYLVGAYYDPSAEFAITWDDPDLHIAWPDMAPILSDRDKKAKTLRELFPEKFPRS